MSPLLAYDYDVVEIKMACRWSYAVIIDSISIIVRNICQ